MSLCLDFNILYTLRNFIFKINLYLSDLYFLSSLNCGVSDYLISSMHAYFPIFFLISYLINYLVNPNERVFNLINIISSVLLLLFSVFVSNLKIMIFYVLKSAESNKHFFILLNKYYN